MVSEKCSATDRIFSHFGPFLPFYPPSNPDNQNFEKLQENAWRSHFTHMYHK